MQPIVKPQKNFMVILRGLNELVDIPDKTLSFTSLEKAKQFAQVFIPLGLKVHIWKAEVGVNHQPVYVLCLSDMEGIPYWLKLTPVRSEERRVGKECRL